MTRHAPCRCYAAPAGGDSDPFDEILDAHPDLTARLHALDDLFAEAP